MRQVIICYYHGFFWLWKSSYFRSIFLSFKGVFYLTSHNKHIVQLTFFQLPSVNDIVRNDEQIAETNRPEVLRKIK